jgi:hypothetical protein
VAIVGFCKGVSVYLRLGGSLVRAPAVPACGFRAAPFAPPWRPGGVSWRALPAGLVCAAPACRSLCVGRAWVCRPGASAGRPAVASMCMHHSAWIGVIGRCTGTTTAGRLNSQMSRRWLPPTFRPSRASSGNPRGQHWAYLTTSGPKTCTYSALRVAGLAQYIPANRRAKHRFCLSCRPDA